MNKAYERINWENYPSENTALDEINLNKMDAALNEVDNRVVAHETTKLDVATANSMVKNVSFNERSGIFTITYLNGSTKELDTKLEKIVTNFVYDEERQKLILTLIDGTTQEIDMSALITQYEFENSAYISFTVVNGKVKAEIINGSITADKLQPNFLADVTLQANSAKTSEQNAKVSEENAKQSEINAKNYADSAEPVASTAQGLNPTLDNSTAAPIISFNGDGATEQQTYSGKNELNATKENITHSSVTVIKNADGTYTATGTATVNNATLILGDFTFKANVEYKLVGAPKGSTAGFNNYEMLIIANNEYYHAGYSGKKISFAEDVTTSIRIWVKVGQSVDGLVFKPMITTDLDATYDDYEPYVGGTASPNPSYPQEIYGAGESGVLSVKSTGKNIFDLENAEWNNKYNASNIITVEDNKLTMSGLWYNDTEIKLEPNTDYFISADYTTNNSGDHTGKIVIKLGDNATNLNVSKNGHTFNSGDHTEGILRFYASNNTSGITTWTNIQLEKGTVRTEYEPYVETTADIPLSSPLYEKDYIKYRMDGTGEESHVSVEVVFDGSDDEVWARNALNSGANPYYFINVGSNGDIVADSVKCTHLTQASVSTSNTINGINAINSSLGYARIIMRPSAEVCTDETTFRAWLAENKPKVVYELTEPTVTPLTAEQIAEFEKLRSFDGTTHVTCEAESEIQYFYDSVSGKAVAMVANMLKK